MKKSLNVITAALFVSSTALASAAFAQSTAPSATTPGAANPPAATTTAPTTIAPGSNTQGTTGAMPNSSAAAGTYLTEQSPDQLSANDFIGQTVYNAANESIGNINDLIIQDNGGIVAAIVGVGGFLGIGQKNVAVPMDKITATQDAQSNDMRLTTTETAESLQAAPEFRTLDQQRADSGSNAPMTGTDTTTTSSTVTK